jgi:hypothetical protein
METTDNTHGIQFHNGCISCKTDKKNITYYSIGDNKICYSYYGIYYASSFPTEWALNHLPKTGPHECLDCLYYGTYKGIFIDYCLNCAKNEYKDACVTECVDKNNLSLFHVLHILKKDEMIDSEIIDMINDRYDALINVDEEFNDSDTDSNHVLDEMEPIELVEQDDNNPIVLNYDEINNYVDPRDKYQFDEEYYGVCADSYNVSYGSNYNGGYDSH